MRTPWSEAIADNAASGSAVAGAGLSAASLTATVGGETVAGIIVGVSGLITAIGSIIVSIIAARSRAKREEQSDRIIALEREAESREKRLTSMEVKLDRAEELLSNCEREHGHTRGELEAMRVQIARLTHGGPYFEKQP